MTYARRTSLPAVAIFLVALLTITTLLSLATGAFRISLSDLFGIIGDGPSRDTTDAVAHNVFWQVRLPRIVLAIIVGASLAVAGVIMQGIFRNPLAEPATVGVSAGAAVGADSWLKPRVTVADRCEVGARCRLQSGAVVGSDGFGYEPVGDRVERIPQVGTVVLEDDVEVGANTTLDRARFSRTVVGRGTKIDNLVQVAHNVRIGRQCLITAQVGIAGSTVLGDGCVLGGQSGVAGHLRLGDGVRLGAQAGLFEDVPAGGFMNGSPAVPFGLERRMAVLSRRLPELFKKVDSLAAALDALRKDAP